MNRANFGNIVTNAGQTLSVSGFTASGYLRGQQRQRLADASSALNHMTEDELNALGVARANASREQIRQDKNVTDPMRHLSDEEEIAYGNRRTEDIREYIDGEDESVDDILADTPEASAISQKSSNDIKWLHGWIERDEQGKFRAKQSGGDE